MRRVVVRGQRLPGVGWRYDLALAGGARLVVVVEDGGRRHLMVMRHEDSDPLVSVAMTAEQSLALAALVSGARVEMVEEGAAIGGFGVPAAGAGGEPAGEVLVESVVLKPSADAVGLSADELDRRLGADAALLAVISDETPEIVEEEPGRPTRPGDRVVVAVRRSRADAAMTLLAP